MSHQDFSTYRGNQPRSTHELREWHASLHAETALEPGLPIVDAHHHLYGQEGDAHFYRREDLGQDLASGHRVIGTIYVEAYGSGWRTDGPEIMRSVGEVEMIAGLSKNLLPTSNGACQVAAGIVSNADLTLGEELTEVLQAHVDAGHQRLRGVRHHANYVEGTIGKLGKNPPSRHLLADTRFRRGFACLSRFGLSFDALIYHTQLDELAELADAFPETHIALNHVGIPVGVAEFSSRRASVFAQWRQGMRALAARPNVCIKLGGMGMPVFGFGWEAQRAPASSAALARAWQPLIDVCIETFGPKRCMFESNFPVDKQSCNYASIWNAFKIATSSLTPAERNQLFYQAACQFYRLPELADRCDNESKLLT